MHNHNRELDHYKSLFENITNAIGGTTVNQIYSTLGRLYKLFPNRSLFGLKLLLPFGGGKDSAWALSYVRLMQLFLRRIYDSTFKLEIYLMIHPGVPRGVLDNINSVFRSLGIYGDDEVSVVATTRGGEPVSLGKGTLASSVIEGFRKEILITGHLSRGNGRETFCNACNLTLMSEIVRLVVSRNGEIDVVVTGDSTRETWSYWRWIQKTCGRFMIPRIPASRANWGTLFSQIAKINDAYYSGLYGYSPKNDSNEGFLDILKTGINIPLYFSLFEDTQYEYHNHQAFLENFLGFHLREDAFNFTESDCRNPLLMAHLRGLLGELEGPGYIAGVRDYLELVKYLMMRKSYSDQVMALALSGYKTDNDIIERRREAEDFAASAFYLTTTHLETMVASPVADAGRRLDQFLAWRHTDKKKTWNFIRKAVNLLARTPVNNDLLIEDDPELLQGVKFLRDVTGMDISSLILIAHSQTSSGSAANSSDVLGILRKGDIHKMELSSSKIDVNRIITGR